MAGTCVARRRRGSQRRVWMTGETHRPRFPRCRRRPPALRRYTGGRFAPPRTAGIWLIASAGAPLRGCAVKAPCQGPRRANTGTAAESGALDALRSPGQDRGRRGRRQRRAQEGQGHRLCVAQEPAKRVHALVPPVPRGVAQQGQRSLRRSPRPGAGAFGERAGAAAAESGQARFVPGPRLPRPPLTAAPQRRTRGRGAARRTRPGARRRAVRARKPRGRGADCCAPPVPAASPGAAPCGWRPARTAGFLWTAS